MNVPKTPRATIGNADSRKLRPADVQTTVEQDHDQRDDGDPFDLWIGACWYRLGQMSETAAAAIRKMAGDGIGRRSVSFDRQQSQPKARADEKDDGSEVGDFAHDKVIADQTSRHSVNPTRSYLSLVGQLPSVVALPAGSDDTMSRRIERTPTKPRATRCRCLDRSRQWVAQRGALATERGIAPWSDRT